MENREFNRTNTSEFHDVAPEYMPVGCEYNPASEEFYQNNMVSSQKSKKNSKLRKISYLVASCLAVVVIGQTLDMLPNITIDETPDTIVDENLSGANDTRILLSEYESWGYARGNVIPIQKNGLWGLMDYEGKILLEPTYTEFWSSPNDDGYSIFRDDKGYYIHDKAGRLALEITRDAYSVVIGEDNVVLVKQAKDANNEYLDELPLYANDAGATSFCYTYRKINGDIIYDTGWKDGGIYFNVAGPFYEGKAYLYLDEEEAVDTAILYEVTYDGIREIDRGAFDADENGSLVLKYTYAPLSPLVQGYYLAEAPGSGGGWYLFRPETLTATPCFTSVSGDFLPGYTAEESWLTTLKYYRINGVNAYNYYTYGVATIADDYGGEKIKDVLFDYSDMSGSDELTKAIAIYDDIAFDDFKYLSVTENNTSFYIDYNGKVVSDTYDATTSFNDRGYAMIREDNIAYIINDKFERVVKIDKVAAIGYNDDTFVVQCEDESIALYYY